MDYPRGRVAPVAPLGLSRRSAVFLRGAGPRERIPVRMVLIVGGLSLFGPLCVDLYLAALPEISRSLNAGASAVQLSLTACLVGLAMGQIVVGPVSDRLGRRRPLLVGVCAFVLASAACAVAQGIVVLIVLRFVQGVGGAAGIVISRAVVRDLYSGAMAARVFSLVMLATGVGPVLGPQVGAGLLQLGSWRLLFVALAVIGLLLLAMAMARLPETLPNEHRSSDGFAATARAVRRVMMSRTFVLNALGGGLGFGALFAYIAGSSFALENVYGLSPQVFSLVFGINAVGLVCASQVNGRLVGRIGPRRLLTVGLVGLAIGGAGSLLVVMASVGLVGVVVSMFIVMTAYGFVAPNAMALALNDFPESAGSAAAMAGVFQFLIGALAAPLVGLGGTHDVLPMAVVMAACGLSAICLRFVLRSAQIPVRASEIAATDVTRGVARPDVVPHVTTSASGLAWLERPGLAMSMSTADGRGPRHCQKREHSGTSSSEIIVDVDGMAVCDDA